MDAAVQEAKDQAELNDLLIWASARGLLADAVELIARGADLCIRDKQGFAPVHYAAAQGHLDVLQYLATKGADLEAEDPQARMPLHYAAAGSSVEVLRFLIQRSTWLDAADGADDTALHLAAKRGWLPGIKLLLAADAAVDIPNKRGLSALGEALAGGHTTAAQTLVSAGADVGWRAAGYTLLHVAAGLDQAESLQLLLQQPQGRSLLNDASNGDTATPLHAAAMAGSAACVQLLLKQGADAGAAGVGGLLPWEVVHADTPEAERQLAQQLQQAAGVKTGSTSSKKQFSSSPSPTRPTASSTGAAAAASAADGAGAGVGDDGSLGSLGPVEAYSAQFAGLNVMEQGRKVDTFARMSEAGLAQLDFLSAEAKTAISQVRRAHQLLACYRAVAALRSDEAFQEDASGPAVQAALHEMAVSNSFDKYKDDRTIMAVAAKLKKFHAVLQECGGVRLGLADVLVKPGQTLDQLMEQDAQQIDGLTAAAAAARAAAVAALAGRPLMPQEAIGVGGGSGGGAGGGGGGNGGAVSSSKGMSKLATGKMGSQASIGEIEAAEPAGKAAGADLDLDLQLQQHKASLAQAAAASAPKPLDDMPFGQRMRYELINSFKQALKLMAMLCVFWGIMWCFGLMPGQQDTAELEARMQQLLQARAQAAAAAAAQQQDLGVEALQQGLVGDGRGGEL